MTLTIIKNGSRDFTHVTEFANMTFGYYSMVLNNTLQTVVIKMPNGAQFPNAAISIIDVFFQDNADTGDIESFATTELLKARLIEVDYNGLVEASGGGGATNLGYTASPTNGIVTSSTGTDATIPLADGTNSGLSENNLSDAKESTWNSKQNALTFDTTPTNGSTNPVTSDGVFHAVENIAEIVATGTVSSGTTEQFSLGILVDGSKLRDDDQLEAIIRGKKSGTVGTLTIRCYANATNNTVGSPILLGTVTSISASRVQVMQKFIDIIKKDGTGSGTFTTNPTVSSSNDLGGTGVGQNVAIDWTVNKYIVTTVQCSNASDTAFISSIKIRR